MAVQALALAPQMMYLPGMEDIRQKIFNLIKAFSVRVVPRGSEFTLSSGEKSRVYCDLKQTALLGEAAQPLASLIVSTASSLVPAGVPVAYAGVALGGCHLASIASFHSGGDAVHVRKEAKGHGTKKLVEAPSMAPGTVVVLVEDVTTTAGSALKALNALKEEGYTVAGIVTVVDRRGSWSGTAPESVVGGVPILSVFRLEEFADEGDADHGSPF